MDKLIPVAHTIFSPLFPWYTLVSHEWMVAGSVPLATSTLT